jgi:hypothetical protein
MLRKKRFGKEHIVHTIHHLVDWNRSLTSKFSCNFT